MSYSRRCLPLRIVLWGVWRWWLAPSLCCWGTSLRGCRGHKPREPILRGGEGGMVSFSLKGILKIERFIPLPLLVTKNVGEKGEGGANEFKPNSIHGFKIIHQRCQCMYLNHQPYVHAYADHNNISIVHIIMLYLQNLSFSMLLLS